MEVDLEAVLPKLAQRIAQLEIQLAVMEAALEKYESDQGQGPEE